jgi:seryl-tRNA synthetase
MIDIALLRDQPEIVKTAVQNRGWDVDVDAIRSADAAYRALLSEVEAQRAALNKGPAGKPSEEELVKLREQKEQLKTQEHELGERKAALDTMLRDLPNFPRPDVPVGKNETENKVLREVGEPRTFDFEPKEYTALAEQHDLLDMERAAKVSGARFVYFKNDGALLSMALVRYGLEIALGAGFKPILPPVLINETSMAGMGYIDHGGEDETYHFDKDGLYLVGTSEQAIGPMHSGEILDESQLPLRYVAFSNCFRREAGSYGKDTKGIIRMHQFDKLEMFSICTPEQADDEHAFLLSLEEKFMQGLELPYRVLTLCTGDIGGPSARTYDIEAWVPSQNTYRETHSTSTTTDFQSRRLQIRYRTKDGEVRFVHMLNGTMVAVSRTPVALLENHQQSDGTVRLPAALHPHFFGKTQIG